MPQNSGKARNMATFELCNVFTNSAPLGQVGHIVAVSVCVSVCLFVCAIGCSFFRGLSSALRSHDQFQASHWSSPPNPWGFPRVFLGFSRGFPFFSGVFPGFSLLFLFSFLRKITQPLKNKYIFLDKSRNLSNIVSVLLSASVERFCVSRMRDFIFTICYPIFRSSYIT